MATHYIENASSGSQYYFNTNSATTSQSQRTHNSSPYGSSGYTTHPVQTSNQQYESFHSPQQYQSVAGFSRNSTQQQRYQTPQSPAPQVRASVRVLGSQDQYNLSSSSQPIQVSPQQHHFQFDSHQQAGRPSGPAVVYQTPGAAQYTHHNVDLWTEGPSSSSNQDHYAQAQRVTVRSVSTGSPQQSHSVSPQRHQDHLQQYYSQLTPEQHQQLLRQQQLQSQQQHQTSHHDQQRQITVQQVSPSSTHQHEQHQSTAGFSGTQQGRGRSASERQRQDEQDYHSSQRQVAAQRAHQLQYEEEPSHPVGIKNLMSKFGGIQSGQSYQPRSKSSTSRQYSNSSYTTNSGPRQTTTTTRTTTQSMTYSALPKNYEPPVNSVEYYQMQQMSGSPFVNIQQAAAPSHIQHTPTPTAFGSLRDRFTFGSVSEDFNRPPQVVNRQQQQQQQQYQQQQQQQQQQQYQQQQYQQQQYQQQQQNTSGGSLTSMRDQYMHRAKELSSSELPPQQIQNISRSIVGEDIPQQKYQKVAPPQVMQQPVPVQQQPPLPQQQQQAPLQQEQPPPPQQQPAPVQQEQPPPPPQQQQEQPPTENNNTSQQAPSSEAAPPPTTNDTTTAAEPPAPTPAPAAESSPPAQSPPAAAKTAAKASTTTTPAAKGVATAAKGAK